MKKVLFAVATVAVTFAFAWQSFAQIATAKSLNYTGEIVHLVKNTVTVKSPTDLAKTFVAVDKTQVVTTNKAVAALVNLKVGDQVKVAYTENGARLIASEIALLPAPKQPE